VRAVFWFGLIMLPALSVAAEGTPAVMGEVQVAELLMRMAGAQWPNHILVRDEDRVRAFAKYGSREAQALRAALGAGATAR
jgi:hypothetical protein